MRTNFYLTPHDCPCQQCFNLIPAATWVEASDDRVRYLWRCDSCDYEFETIAVYHDKDHAPGLAAQVQQAQDPVFAFVRGS